MDNSRNNIKINFIEPNTKVIGEIHSESDFRIDGTLEGTVQTTGRVVVGQEGKIKGKIKATSVNLKLTSSTDTHMVSNTLVVETGATLLGKFKIGA